MRTTPSGKVLADPDNSAAKYEDYSVGEDEERRESVHILTTPGNQDLPMVQVSRESSRRSQGQRSESIVSRKTSQLTGSRAPNYSGRIHAAWAQQIASLQSTEHAMAQSVASDDTGSSLGVSRNSYSLRSPGAISITPSFRNHAPSVSGSEMKASNWAERIDRYSAIEVISLDGTPSGVGGGGLSPKGGQGTHNRSPASPTASQIDDLVYNRKEASEGSIAAEPSPEYSQERIDRKVETAIQFSSITADPDDNLAFLDREREKIVAHTCSVKKMKAICEYLDGYISNYLILPQQPSGSSNNLLMVNNESSLSSSTANDSRRQSKISLVSRVSSREEEPMTTLQMNVGHYFLRFSMDNLVPNDGMYVEELALGGSHSPSALSLSAGGASPKSGPYAPPSGNVLSNFSTGGSRARIPSPVPAGVRAGHRQSQEDLDRLMFSSSRSRSGSRERRPSGPTLFTPPNQVPDKPTV